LLVDAVTAAKLLGISRTTLDKLVRDGRLARVKLAGRVLFSTELLRKIAKGEA
jgi:excisionase family DNA binding protein